MNGTAIISIIYEEPEWSDTERCIDRCADKYAIPIYHVNRRGVGSLAKSINSGFRQWGNGFKYIWFITNVTFRPECLEKLIEAADETGFAAITPSFESDHLFCRPKPECAGQCLPVPFVEFTAPLVRSSVLRDFPLNEDMPYWGHDLDWGHRVRQAGHKVGVLYGETLGHTYIRNNKGNHHITLKRRRLRSRTNNSTREALIREYGPEWRKVLCWR